MCCFFVNPVVALEISFEDVSKVGVRMIPSGVSRSLAYLAPSFVSSPYNFPLGKLDTLFHSFTKRELIYRILCSPTLRN